MLHAAFYSNAKLNTGHDSRPRDINSLFRLAFRQTFQSKRSRDYYSLVTEGLFGSAVGATRSVKVVNSVNMQHLLKIGLLLVLLMKSSGYNLRKRDWSEWKELYGKSYNVEEKAVRFAIWEKNYLRILQHNAEADQGIHSYKLEMNEFGDLEELPITKLPFGTGPCNETSRHFHLNEFDDLPPAVDWRKNGAVTPVQNQGGLGQSWTYSATGALEAQNFLKSGNLLKLSEQNLADCANNDFSHYCAVGSPECAFYYVYKNGGVDIKEGYPKMHDGQCHYDPTTVGGTCSGCYYLPSSNEESLQKAVATVGPVSAYIDASQTTFQFYKSGIYDDPSCRSVDLNHNILIVGYGIENGKEFWIVKNSWGSSWGENGYIRIARNQGNICGIATRASFPAA